MFWSHVKVLVKQIQEMRQFPDLPGSFRFGANHPISHVELVGLIVHVRQYEQYFLCNIDDGNLILNSSFLSLHPSDIS